MNICNHSYETTAPAYKHIHRPSDANAASYKKKPTLSGEFQETLHIKQVYLATTGQSTLTDTRLQTQ